MMTTEETLTISERCRALRQKLQLSQQEMADEIGVTIHTWQNWEAGRSTPRAPILKLISQMENWAPVDYADRSQRLRLKLGKSKGEMAEIFGVNAHTWGYWEAGTQRPSPDMRKKIDELLAAER